MPLLALPALAARHRGIDRDAGACEERLAEAVDGAVRGFDHDAAELVAEHQRRLDDDVAYAPGLVHVQIGSADADAADLDTDLAGGGRRQRRARSRPEDREEHGA